MNIIKKLGIKPIESHPVRNGYVCDTLEVRIIEQQRNEMLEALVDIAIDESFFTLNRESQRRIDIARKTLKKINGKTWEEIKQLIEKAK